MAAPACRKEDQPRSGPSPAASDRFADGKRLTSALEEWRTRWQSVAAPPSCEALLPKPDERQLCADAGHALERVKERATALDKSSAALDAAAELARTAAAAEKRLRFRDMEYMGTQGLSWAAPSAAPSARPKPSATPKPAASGDGEPGVKREDPYKPALSAYSKLGAEALRYLSAFLELGPQPTRQVALGVAEKLWGDAGRPAHALQQVVRQAYLLESDGTLKERLRKLDLKARLAPPTGSAK